MEENTPKSKKKHKSSTNWPLTIGISLVLTAIVLLIWFFLRGETTVTGGWTASESTESLVCEASNISYPLFNQSDTRGNIKITATFSNDDIHTISLFYKTRYNSEKDLSNGRVSSRASLETTFHNDGLENEALGVVYSSLDSNIFQMSLYASNNDLNPSAYKYFMLNETNTGYTQALANQIYTGKGFNCTNN